MVLTRKLSTVDRVVYLTVPLKKTTHILNALTADFLLGAVAIGGGDKYLKRLW